MIDDGTHTAVLDRFEDELAVLLVEGEEDLVGELVVDQKELPEDGQHVDAVFTVEIATGELSAATYQAAETNDRTDESQSRFDRLSQRPPSDDDDDQ
ncbi:DUF3006 domain-containing protein [Halorientalis halophila]|uniref:DUF3006 domain-containing protein n=1 Tax=Halorientalis halophila TaxID=3108499 RepID=UPI0030098BC3